MMDTDLQNAANKCFMNTALITKLADDSANASVPAAVVAAVS